MMRAMFGPIRVLVTLWLLYPGDVSAQVPPPALANVRVDASVTLQVATKIYTYRYRITNPPENALAVSSVALEITLPPNSIRPRGSTELPSGSFFQNPDTPGGIPRSTDFPYDSVGDYYRAESGLNFVPVGISSPPNWTIYRVTPSNELGLLGKAMKAGWDAVNRFQRPMQSVPIAPGETVDGFVVTSFGLPGIRRVEFQPNKGDLLSANLLPEEWRTNEEDSDELFDKKKKLQAGLGYVTDTVGPTALPSGYTNATLVTRLQSLLDQCAGLSWIMDAGLSAQLKGFLTQAAAALQQNQPAVAKASLQQFITAITTATSAQRRQEASDLLSLNAQFIVDHITVVAPTTAMLSPTASQLGLNETQTLTLSVTAGAVWQYGRVQAVILSGPNAGKAFSGTLTNGQWTFSWVGRAEGTDVVQAHYNGRPPKYVVAGDPELSSTIPCDPSFLDCMDSNSVAVTWSGGPDLTLGHLRPPALQLPTPTGTVTIDEMTVNIGTATAPASKTRYYLSTSRVLDVSAITLGERDVALLAPNESSSSVRDFTLPSIAPGVYWLLACADGAVQVAELDETNNCDTAEVSVAALIGVPSECDPAKPTIAIGGPTTLCPGGSVTLTASQGTDYQWSNGATTQSIVVSESGSYSAMVTVTPGCTATSDPVIVTIADTQPPTISACPAKSVLAAGPSCQAAVPDMRPGVTTSDNCMSAAGLVVTQSPMPGSFVGLGMTPVTFTVADAAGNVSTCSSSIEVVDNTPPTITACAPEKIVPADNNCQGLVPEFTKTLSATDNCTPPTALVISQVPTAGAVVGLGRTPVILTVRDAAGNATTCASAFTVVDVTPPVILNPTASRASLWPPDHKMVNVTVDYGLSDNCPGVIASALSISCNEPVDGLGDGNTSVDWNVVDAHHVQLRAERAGTASDRIYTITITARDAAGKASSSVVTVTVPH